MQVIIVFISSFYNKYRHYVSKVSLELYQHFDTVWEIKFVDSNPLIFFFFVHMNILYLNRLLNYNNRIFNFFFISGITAR